MRSLVIYPPIDTNFWTVTHGRGPVALAYIWSARDNRPSDDAIREAVRKQSPRYGITDQTIIREAN